MTFAVLRSLHTIIGDALDDIERVYNSHGYSESTNNRKRTDDPSSAHKSTTNDEYSIPRSFHKQSSSTSQAYASPPPSPSITTSSHTASYPMSATPLDFPSLDLPCDPVSLSEVLTSHPTVVSAISRIIAAAGQLSATVQTPFLTLCDATMGYHLPSCMRILEASHTVEILREAGPSGLHVEAISEKNEVDSKKLAHILRLLATHHILREVLPDVFSLNRISSTVDSGKTFAELKEFSTEGRPEMKYRDTNGVSAFVGLCTDEIQKSSAYMTETYLLSPSKQTRAGTDPARAPFCFAFDTLKTGSSFFGWLEGEADTKKRVSNGIDPNDDWVETGRGAILPPGLPASRQEISKALEHPTSKTSQKTAASSDTSKNAQGAKNTNWNRFRLERFGKAMSGTDGWEAPGAVLNGFDWYSLPHGSIVVDVGGGIGSTSMLLASVFSADEEGLGLKFIIQDRPVVCEMGEKAWKAECPKLLETTARFQVHDFFTPQPVLKAAVFLLRVVLHDWPDEFARKILLRLREAATPETKLLIADFVLPLACPDDMSGNGDLENIEGVESILAPAPLLPNLGKASANVYWMDMTMQVMFNAKERTLRETVMLAASAGWKVVRVTKAVGSLFGHIVAVPVLIPEQPEDIGCEPSPSTSAASERKATPYHDEVNIMEHEERRYRTDLEVIERSSSRCGTPTFGSNMKFSSVQDALARFGGGVVRSRSTTRTTPSGSALHPPAPLKPALSLSLTTAKKKKPSPLSLHSSPKECSVLHSPSSATGRKTLSTSPKHEYANINSHSRSPAPHSPNPRIITRRLSLANLRSTQSRQALSPPPPLPLFACQLPSPLSPRHPIPQSSTSPTSNTHTPIARRSSHAHLYQAATSQGHTRVHSQTQGPVTPSFIPIRNAASIGAEPTSPGTGTHQIQKSSYPGGGSGSLLASLSSTIVGQSTTTFGTNILPRSIPRRASHAQLPQKPLRNRSGTVIGSSVGSNTKSGINVWERETVATLEVPSGRSSGFSSASSYGSVLRFDCHESEGGKTSPSEPSNSQPFRERGFIGESRIVLAAAAKIERGDFVKRSSPPSP